MTTYDSVTYGGNVRRTKGIFNDGRYNWINLNKIKSVYFYYYCGQVYRC